MRSPCALLALRRASRALGGVSWRRIWCARQDLPKEGFEGAGEYAAATAAAKAEEVARRLEAEGRGGRLVIGADTVVEAPGELDLSEAVLEKPANEEHARRMLLRLSGATHRVHTGVAVVLPGETAARTFHETTRVTFGPLDEGAIAAYVATGDCMDKAGSYGIQGAAGAFVSGIEGCYFNVVRFCEPARQCAPPPGFRHRPLMKTLTAFLSLPTPAARHTGGLPHAPFQRRAGQARARARAAGRGPVTCCCLCRRGVHFPPHIVLSKSCWPRASSRAPRPSQRATRALPRRAHASEAPTAHSPACRFTCTRAPSFPACPFTRQPYNAQRTHTRSRRSSPLSSSLGPGARCCARRACRFRRSVRTWCTAAYRTRA